MCDYTHSLDVLDDIDLSFELDITPNDDDYDELLWDEDNGWSSFESQSMICDSTLDI